VEFFYNNILSATTGVSLFFTNKSYYSSISVHLKHNITFTQAYDFVVNLDRLQSILKFKIATAQQSYQKSANVWWSSIPNLKVDNKVFVNSQSSTLLFILCLPESIYSIYPVFYIFILEPVTFNAFSERIQPVPVLVITNKKFEYEIMWIVNFKID